MKKNYSIKNKILSNNKLNYLITTIISIGFITGCIFLMLISEADKEVVVNSVVNFVNNINTNRLELIKNISMINFMYIILLFIFSLSIVGSLLNVIIIYFKSFILGFTISSLFYVYKLKAIPIVFSYLLPSQIINLFVIFILGIYSLLFSYKLIGQIINSKNNYIKFFIKKYIIIVIICIVLTIFSSFYESFIFPLIIRLIKKIINY